MSWTHQICDDCWRTLRPDKPEPVRLIEPILVHDLCCFCGRWNGSGIYVRHDPRHLSCRHRGATA